MAATTATFIGAGIHDRVSQGVIRSFEGIGQKRLSENGWWMQGKANCSSYHCRA
ncbi:hypothetical protein [Aliirhizobium cellulosilyticum]|uniref:Uncharacterized protein n=1 Tax=Aliirhizobium cellulosilyticum TaxID=393664 RepID=A0A7W6S836_9HYPH|nr:hypothetical protein [Rhizobium cellulosilyticum]MBB4348165.1 hypothetical protein [Rhizobium cellulosilyticum]MBB4411402.1 hypothetical protein [Rhizobium cellulosilyticum]MBB4446091.1 hypothetical protein [Rhizobium cellulosilyticum]